MCGCGKQTKSIKHSLCFEEVKGRIISSLSLPQNSKQMMKRKYYLNTLAASYTQQIIGALHKMRLKSDFSHARWNNYQEVVFLRPYGEHE